MRASRSWISAFSVATNDTPTLCVGELHSCNYLTDDFNASFLKLDNPNLKVILEICDVLLKNQ